VCEKIDKRIVTRKLSSASPGSNIPDIRDGLLGLEEEV